MNREILDESMGYPHEKPMEIDLKIKVRTLCSLCASTLICFVHSRYDKVIELGVYPCTNPDCKSRKGEKDERR